MAEVILYGLLLLMGSKGLTATENGLNTNPTVVGRIDLRLHFVGLLGDENHKSQMSLLKPEEAAVLSMINVPQLEDSANKPKDNSMEKIKILLGKSSGIPKTLIIDGGVLNEDPKVIPRSYKSNFRSQATFAGKYNNPWHNLYHGKRSQREKRTDKLGRSKTGTADLSTSHHVEKRESSHDEIEAPSKRSWRNGYRYPRYYPGNRYRQYWRWYRPRQIENHPFDELASNIIGR